MNTTSILRTMPFAGAALSFVMVAAVSDARAQGGSWRSTATMSIARWGHTATLLTDGRVLVAGGCIDSYCDVPTPTAEVYDPATGLWTSTGDMNVPRTGHTATLLNDGRVLLTGGGPSTLSSTAELYDPASGTWTNATSMAVRRTDHTATLLNDGRVLITGGGTFTLISTAELYDPATATWTNTGNMNVGRAAHTATLLNDGRVLVAGGAVDIANFTATAELYDPLTGIWTSTDGMSIARARHTATLLNDGTVLIAGGCSGHCVLGYPTSAAELFNPSTGAWSRAGDMADPREFHTATRLANGNVLVTGGLVVRLYDDTPQLTTAEEYDPTTGAWGARTFMSIGRSVHALTLLNDGTALVTGGVLGFFLDYSCDLACSYSWNPTARTNTAEIYVPGGELLAAADLSEPDSCLAAIELTLSGDDADQDATDCHCRGLKGAAPLNTRGRLLSLLTGETAWPSRTPRRGAER